MQRLGEGPGVIPVDAPCPGQLAEEEMLSLGRIYIQGQPLKEFRLNNEAAPLTDAALVMIAELSETVERLHGLVDERGQSLAFVHRDITPSNVIIDVQGKVWLNDFGLALTHYELPLASDETLQGARRYLAPELVRGEQPSAASDVYQLGLLAAYMLDPEKTEPPVDVEERGSWATTLLKPFGAAAAVNAQPENRPPAGEFADILRVARAS